MAKTSSLTGWQRLQAAQAATFIGVVVVAVLYWAQVVLIPLALGVFLAFLLTPLVLALQRRGLGRIPSLVTVVALALLALAGLGWLVTIQMTHLYRELPGYAKNCYAKTAALRDLGLRGVADGIDPAVQQVTGVPPPTAPGPGAAPPAPAGAAPAPANEAPARAVQQPESTPWLSRLPEALVPVLSPLGAVGLAVVLAVFMLLKREDLRNRLLRLVGHGRMTVTTKAVDEAGARISRYLLMQLIVNGTYGLAWGLGLFVIGVDYAPLWGFLAAALRYVPYVGAPVAALLPLALSLIQFEAWTQPILVVALLVVLELVSNNVMEPWLYGQSIGVSEVALIVAATFWAFLWGPIGLVLSGPLTVCLVVLGRYVPPLEFFAVLLGDEPALAPHVAYYQRLLAGDQDEAEDLVRSYVKDAPPGGVYDALLVPALNFVKRDRERGELSEQDQEFVLRATREIVEDLAEDSAAAAGAPVADREKVRLVGCPARDEADRLALEMLRQLLDPAKWEVEILSERMLAAEQVSQAAERRPAVLCIAALRPGGLAHTRYLCKRLHARIPGVRVVVGRWGVSPKDEQIQEQLREASPELVATTLLETQAQLNAWLPVLAAHKSEVAPQIASR